MGKVLFIRVSAETYDESEVPKMWPHLYQIVFSDEPDPMLQKIGNSSPYGGNNGRRGVLELVQGLEDKYHYADSFPCKAQLESTLDKLQQAKEQLDAALSNRDAASAYQVTNTIEDLLSQADALLIENQ